MSLVPALRWIDIKTLSELYEIDTQTVRNNIENIEPVNGNSRPKLYNMRDVTELKDTRYKNPNSVNAKRYDDDDGDIETDPEKMTAIERINHFRAEDLRQSSIIKMRKNDVDCKKLLVAEQVERTIAEAFKKIALTLDTLPDLLERDGIINNNAISKVTKIMDNSREQLAIDLSEISLTTAEINEKGIW